MPSPPPIIFLLALLTLSSSIYFRNHFQLTPYLTQLTQKQNDLASQAANLLTLSTNNLNSLEAQTDLATRIQLL